MADWLTANTRLNFRAARRHAGSALGAAGPRCASCASRTRAKPIRSTRLEDRARAKSSSRSTPTPTSRPTRCAAIRDGFARTRPRHRRRRSHARLPAHPVGGVLPVLPDLRVRARLSLAPDLDAVRHAAAHLWRVCRLPPHAARSRRAASTPPAGSRTTNSPTASTATPLTRASA